MECASGIVEALNTRVYGNGNQTLVLSHGFGADQSVWHFVIPALAVYVKGLVYDLVFSPNVNPKLYDPKRYHENFPAYAQDLTCILDQLHLKDTVLIGYSLSPMVGCIAAAKRPDLFRLNGSPRHLNARHYHGGFSGQQLNTIFRNIRCNFSGWAHDLAPQAIGMNDSAAIAESSLQRMNPKTALDVAITPFLADNRPVLGLVRVRSTIIQTHQDIFVPERVALHMKSKMKHFSQTGDNFHSSLLTVYFYMP